MGPSKKECRKYADPGLSFPKSCGLLCAKQVKHIVRSAVRNIDGRRTLILYIYNREQAATGDSTPAFTVFQTKTDYAACARDKDGNITWRTSSLYNLFNGTGSLTFYSPKDCERVTRFCQHEKNTGLTALTDLQSKIMKKRLDARIRKRERKVIERMETVPPEPRDLKAWIRHEVLPGYIFYEYTKSGKPAPAFCTFCGKDVTVTGAKHNKPGVCPNCRRTVTFKSNGRSEKVWDRTTVQTLCKTGENEIVLRIFKAIRLYSKRELRHEHVWENARCFIRWDDSGKKTIEPFYYAYSRGILTHWQKGERPVMNRWASNFEADTCGHLYCNNLDAALSGTPWKYSQLECFFNFDREPLEVIPYLRAYSNYPMLEYLVKLGLQKLAAHVIYDSGYSSAINKDGRNLREILGVGPEDIPMMQRLNIDVSQFALLKELRAQQLPPDEALLRWCRENHISGTDNIVLPLRYTTPLKLMRYAEESFARLKDTKTRYGSRRYEKLQSIRAGKKSIGIGAGFITLEKKVDKPLYNHAPCMRGSDHIFHDKDKPVFLLFCAMPKGLIIHSGVQFVLGTY